MTEQIKIFNLEVAHFIHIKKLRIPIEHIFVLEILFLAKDGDGFPPEFLTPMQFLERKGYIDVQGKTTQAGKDLLAVLSSPASELLKKDVKKAKKTNTEEKDSFEEWWKIYPGTDYFEHKGRTFKGTQSKKMKKEECRRLFIIMCNSNFTAEEIIRATRFHVDMAKDTSYKKGENQISFIANSERYLRERKFEPFISLSLKQEIKEQETDLTVNL